MTLLPKQLVAHRGHRDRFPENSLLAIKDAIAAGAVNIEFDIQFTRDGVPILYHDDTMQRISGVDHAITQLSSIDLSDHAAFEPERLGQRFRHNPIESLMDLLPVVESHGAIDFFMELKEESLAAHGEDFCFQHLKNRLPIIPNNLVLISFSEAAVKRAKAEGFSKTALVFRNWSARNQLLRETQADSGFINYQRIPETDAIIADKPIMVYEVDDSITAKQLLTRGAVAVETFCIRALLNNL
jgi:glycerophosphoryl diester phosphodiesterase